MKLLLSVKRGKIRVTDQVPVTRRCCRRGESGRRGWISDCDWRLRPSTGTNRNPVKSKKKKKNVGLMTIGHNHNMSIAGGLRMLSRQKSVALTLFPENPINSSNLKIL